ncbi:heat shock 70 kDa protein 4-like [Babylonia areolata]|uniref:heat shock 70 kDa protein 4-like n=1 Tax=Babylonia areolata TaxID=304850 RepID=UPI003FD1114E
MAVVGFDVGTFSSYIGVARAGGIETIANEYSDRCTPSFISLNEKSRSIGAASKQQVVTNFRNTVGGGVKRVLGRSFKDPFVQKEVGRFFRPNVIEEDTDGSVVFRLSYMGEQQTFTPTQIVAMLLSKLKQTAETGLSTKVVDVVMSVPVYFTDRERRALLDACVTSGLNCLRLINDTTAAALGYGITKQDLPAETDKPRVVIFADLGYSALQLAACAFHKGKLKVLATSCDPEVGGRDFDEVLAKHFSAEFRTKYKVDAEDPKNPKPYIRLLQECEKLKKLMSANTQKIPLNIECFMNDKDVTSGMNREDFEKLSEHLLKRIENTLSNVLVNAKLTPGDIDSVEIMGGSSRIPAFKRLVSQVFSKEPSTTLNADEAVARGCALQCAILSPTFRVRDFNISDCQTYPISLSWAPQSQGDDDSGVDVFPQFYHVPASRMVTLTRKEPFTLTAVYTQPDALPFPVPHIGEFKVNNVSPQANGEGSKVKVKVRINGNGIFSVSGASVQERVEGEEEGMEVDGEENKESAAPQTNGLPQEVPTPMEEGEKAPQENNCEQNNTPNNTENGTNDKQGEEKTEEKKGGGKKKSKVKTVDLPIDSAIPQLSRDVLNLFTEKEGQMIMQDRLEKERADAKNSVEEYVYEMRDKLSNEYEQYMKEEDRSAFSQQLEETENWLYEEGEDENKQVYVDRLAQLQKVGGPVVTRYREAQQWPEASDQFGAAVMHVRKFLDQYEAGDEKYAHLDKTDVDKVKKCLEEKMAWWGPKLEAHRKLQPFDNPLVLVSQVMAEKKALVSTCTPIMTKPKPKVEPPKEEKKAEETATAGNTANSGSGDPAQPEQQQSAADADKQDAKGREGDMDVD